MFGKITYIIWLACFIGVPLIALILWHGRALWQQRRALAWVTLGSLVGGSAAACATLVFGYSPRRWI